MKPKTAMRWLWALTAAAVVMGSLLPGSSPAMAALRSINDRLLHFSAYALLAFLPALHEDRFGTAAFATASAALGIALEFAQRYCPGRTFDLEDIASDVAGVLCGVAFGYAMVTRWRKRSAAVGETPKPRPRPVLRRSDANGPEAP